jgi:uncharacterized membrane protein
MAAGPAGGSFSVGDAFGWGWTKFQQNVGPIMIAVLVYLAIIIVVDLVVSIVLRGLFINTATVTIDPTTHAIVTVSGSGFATVTLVNLLGAFVGVLLGAFLLAGITRGALMLANGERLEVGHMFNFDKFGTIAVAAIIVAAATVFICCIGWIIVPLFTPFYLFFIIDKQQGSWESIKSSIELVSQNFGEVILLLLACLLAFIVGFVLCIVGLLVTLPVAVLALTYGYRRLQNEPIAA